MRQRNVECPLCRAVVPVTWNGLLKPHYDTREMPLLRWDDPQAESPTMPAPPVCPQRMQDAS
jgi:hypothetical protein